MLADDLRRHIEQQRTAGAQPPAIDRLLAADERREHLKLKLAAIRDRINQNERHPTYNESESSNEQPS